MDEIFKKYDVNEKGIVSNKKTGHKLKITVLKHGYSTVMLWINGKSKCVTVHRMAAFKYVKNPKSLPCVNHIDGIKTNNHFKNLEWVTRSENSKHAVNLGLIKSLEKSHRSKLTNNDVLFIRKALKEKTHSGAVLARKFNVTKECIYCIRDRKSWKRI